LLEIFKFNHVTVLLQSCYYFSQKKTRREAGSTISCC
jgi:hypothetical protein